MELYSRRENSSNKTFLTTLTHSCSWAPPEKPPIVQPLKNSSAFYGTRRFITVFTRAIDWSLSWARSIQSISPPSYSSKIHFNIVHSPRYWSLSFWLPHQYSICIPLLAHSCYVSCPSHPPWLDHSNYFLRPQNMQLRDLISTFSPKLSVSVKTMLLHCKA
jgi:hypothetical protein